MQVVGQAQVVTYRLCQTSAIAPENLASKARAHLALALRPELALSPPSCSHSRLSCLALPSTTLGIPEVRLVGVAVATTNIVLVPKLATLSPFSLFTYIYIYIYVRCVQWDLILRVFSPYRDRERLVAVPGLEGRGCLVPDRVTPTVLV